jgi:hypothetical protein
MAVIAVWREILASRATVEREGQQRPSRSAWEANTTYTATSLGVRRQRICRGMMKNEPGRGE